MVPLVMLRKGCTEHWALHIGEYRGALPIAHSHNAQVIGLKAVLTRREHLASGWLGGQCRNLA